MDGKICERISSDGQIKFALLFAFFFSLLAHFPTLLAAMSPGELRYLDSPTSSQRMENVQFIG